MIVIMIGSCRIIVVVSINLQKLIEKKKVQFEFSIETKFLSM